MNRLILALALVLISIGYSPAPPPPGGAGGGAKQFRSNPPSTPSVASFPSGATHYYRLGEASGNSRVDSVGSDNLAESGGTVAQTTGISGNAANWAPSTGRLADNLTSADFLSPTSCSFWLNVDTLPGADVDLLQGGAGDEDIKVKITSAGNVVLYTSNDGDLVSIALGSLDSWHLVVVTVSSTTWKLSIDGGTLTSGTAGNAPTDGISITVGTGTTLDAAIDELAIFAGKVLSQQEVSDIWNGGVGTFGSVQQDNLIHYWKLGEASGDNRADSIGSATLIENNSPISNAVGKQGSAVDFPASSAFLASSSFTAVPNAFTVMVWLNCSALPSSADTVFNFDDHVDEYGMITILDNGNIRWQPHIDDISVEMALGSLNTWHLVVGIVTGGLGAEMKISVDGVAFSTATRVAGSVPNSERWLSIGSLAAYKLDEVAVWSVALSQSEVTTLWNGGAGLFL